MGGGGYDAHGDKIKLFIWGHRILSWSRLTPRGERARGKRSTHNPSFQDPSTKLSCKHRAQWHLSMGSAATMLKMEELTKKIKLEGDLIIFTRLCLLMMFEYFICFFQNLPKTSRAEQALSSKKEIDNDRKKHKHARKNANLHSIPHFVFSLTYFDLVFIFLVLIASTGKLWVILLFLIP